jgi:phosphoglycolate phosphatase-like HAD superfamily hydrolase
LKEWKGAAKREVIRHFVQPQAGAVSQSIEIVEQTYQLFRSELQELCRGGICPIAGADDTFLWCRERGIQLATTTGFYSEIRDAIWDATGWRNAFDANICGSDVMRGRPAPFMIFRAMETAGIADVRQVGKRRRYSYAGVAGVVGALTGSRNKDRQGRNGSSAQLCDALIRCTGTGLLRGK